MITVIAGLIVFMAVLNVAEMTWMIVDTLRDRKKNERKDKQAVEVAEKERPQ